MGNACATQSGGGHEEYVVASTQSPLPKDKNLRKDIVATGDEANGAHSVEHMPDGKASSTNGVEHRKRSKVLKADFPDAPEVPPSNETLADIEAIKQWANIGPLMPEDIVIVKGAWNRIIAWKDMLMEAMIYRWLYIDPEVFEVIQTCFDEVPHDFFQLIDRSVRALDQRTEVHHRESYTAGFPACITRDFGENPFEILTHYAILGLRPKHWATLKEAFLWTMKSHNPYMYEHDKNDLAKKNQGAIARFFHRHVVQEANEAVMKVIEHLQGPSCTMIHRQILAIGDFTGIGELFYKILLTKRPDLLDFFSNTDMGNLAKHFEATVRLLGTSQVKLRDMLGPLRRLGEVHRQAMIPAHTFPMLAEVLVATLSTVAEMDKDLIRTWQFLYVAASSIISLPMAVEDRILEEAQEFFEQLAKELEWSEADLEKRMEEVKSQVTSAGTYRHTAQEIEMGARLAWRNAPKCIGRIAWNTLQVRDCRDKTSPEQIFEEVKEHLKAATCGESIQSVMTVFAPRKPNEMWGTRFWNSQFVRFAGYEMKDGSVLGDPANVEFTKLVIDKFGWKPPAKKGKFDPLPQIIQVAGDEPQMFNLPPDLVHCVKFEHPKYKGFAGLGLQWCAVPAITNFNMRIGGINYPCVPFNGWFVDLEIARNLFERYDAGPAVAKVCGVDMSSDAMGWRQVCYAHLCAAVTHSFRKAKFSIVDHYTVSSQFLTHVDRELQAGREVPAQWSWIGGFVGLHCPVWGYEMRDFYLRPQFHYCCEKHVVEDFNGQEGGIVASQTLNKPTYTQRVLIVYASETGTAERFAKRMAQELGPGYRPKVIELNDFNETVLLGRTHVLFFCSTFNNGTHPRNGSNFPDKLSFKMEMDGNPIKTAVMALGSTIYPNFCAFGKKVESVIMAAGAKRFVNTVLADETKDQQASFRQFLGGVKTKLPPSAASAETVQAVLTVDLGDIVVDNLPPAIAETYGHKAAKVISSSELLGNPDKHRSTKLIDIAISGTGLDYHTGGHLSVFPCNPDEEVIALVDAIGIPRDKMYATVTASMVEGESKGPASLHFKPTTVHEMFKWHLDITVRINSIDEVVKMVYEVGAMPHDEFHSLMARDKTELVQEFWWAARVFAAYPDCKGKITIPMLLGRLGRQVPRLYSIASSSTAQPGTVTLCVGLVSAHGAHSGNHHGLCSGYLHGLKPGETVYVTTRQSSFLLPDKPTSPIIMIGTGTGVAPFLGFVQERQHRLTESGETSGEALLYFGCRNSQEVLAQSTINAAKDSGVITGYNVAFSREPGTPKAYVSDAILHGWEHVWKVIENPDCHIYICGDGNMASSAEQALVKCVQASGMSRAKAAQFVESLRVRERFHLDVWGVVKHFQAGVKKDPKMSNMAQKWLNSVLQSEDDFRIDE